MSYRVWSRFQATRSDGSVVKLRIQDLPKSRFGDAADLLIKYFIHEEAFHKAAGVAGNPQAVAEIQVIVKEAMNDPNFYHVICCEDEEKDEDGQIFGVSVMLRVAVDSGSTYSDSNKKKTKGATKEVHTFFELLEATSLQNVMRKFGIAHFYDDAGLIVHPLYRKLGIATELIKARRLACLEHNIPATGAVATSIGTQKATEKDGWEAVQEVDLEQLGRQHGVTMDGVAKLMVWKNPQYKYHYNF